jgi:hypothetical protein
MTAFYTSFSLITIVSNKQQNSNQAQSFFEHKTAARKNERPEFDRGNEAVIGFDPRLTVEHQSAHAGQLR